jgi:starch phosphorylase
MKLMMNGAVTLGTYDGSNVEITELECEDNIKIFGLRAEEVEALRASGTYIRMGSLQRRPWGAWVILWISSVDGTFSRLQATLRAFATL